MIVISPPLNSSLPAPETIETAPPAVGTLLSPATLPASITMFPP